MSNSHSPNLLIVYPDLMRGQALGFLGEEPVRTPHLDRFASQSLVLPQAAASYPVCSPSRAMWMTGVYPRGYPSACANHVTGNCTSRSAPYGVELPQDARCWSDVLHDQGYSLGYVGKWHLDAPYAPYVDCANNRGELKWNEWCPPDRRHGFDYWYSYGTYDVHTRPLYWDTHATRHGFHYVDQWGPEHEADRAIAYLRNVEGRYRDAERPFALVVGMNPPHMPYDLVPDEYVSLYADLDLDALCGRPNIPPAGTEWGDYYRAHVRDYYAMVSGVDAQFGRILAALEEQGLAENTIVLFTSDHGNCLGIHDRISKNNPYEESMRVPFLIRWPGRIPARQDDLLLSTVDVYPTLLDLMGLGGEAPAEVQGTSYARLFWGEETERPSSQLYLWMPVDRPALGRRGLRTERYTYVENRLPGEPSSCELYDRVEDPYQLVEISAQVPEVASELSAALARRLYALGAEW
jgi:arylsulfatase A-like enzyme